jgi:hypothetical protein
VREEVIRADCFDAIREQIQTPQAVEYVRRKIGELLGNYTRELDRDLKECRDRLQRTEDRIKGLVGFIADGDRSEYVVSALRDLEAPGEGRASRDRAAPARGTATAPASSLEAITRGAFGLEQLIAGDTEQARIGLLGQ